MANKKSITTAQQLEKYMRDMQKTPQIIQTDNGTEFKGEFENLIKQSNIQLIHGRPYHPQSQGCVERANKTIWTSLRNSFINYSLSMDEYFNLDLAIDYFTTYYNKKKVHKTTGFRPEILFFESNENVFESVVENVKEKYEKEIKKFNKKIENNEIFYGLLNKSIRVQDGEITYRRSAGIEDLFLIPVIVHGPPERGFFIISMHEAFKHDFPEPFYKAECICLKKIKKESYDELLNHIIPT